MSSVPARVLALHLAPGRRLATRSVPQAYAESAHGFVGDRYENARHRHVTVQSAEELDEAAAVGPGASAALRRRAGAVCRVVSGGTVRVGDEADLLTGSPRVTAS